MENYVAFLEEVINRQEWSADDKFWFSPGERDLLFSIWNFLSRNQTTPHHEVSFKNIWLRREDGTPLNFKVKPCYALDTTDLIGITFLFDRSKTSEEDIFGTFVYHAKLGDLTGGLA
jgi:hypothetical protein